MEAPETPKTLEEEVKGFLSHLRENHLINARIFVTWSEHGQSKVWDHGTGDWYSTFGGIVEWVEAQKQRTRENIKAETRIGGDENEV